MIKVDADFFMSSIMSELINKLSSYNIFNYLFPGVVFVVLSEKYSEHSFLQENVVIGLFYYYFIGLVISRIGSLLIEPVLKKVSFLQFADYRNFVAAAQKDEKIEVLSEVNNTYRTICAIFTSILFLRLYKVVEIYLPVIKNYSSLLLVIFLLLLFLLSYRKQTKYLKKRIDANCEAL